MNCIIAVEKPNDEIIIKNLKKISEFKEWQFIPVTTAEDLLEYAKGTSKPEVLVLSRFLPGKNVIPKLRLQFPTTHIVVLVGEVNRETQDYIKLCRDHGLENIVTGVIPGKRPYTLLVALTHDIKFQKINFENMSAQPFQSAQSTQVEQQSVPAQPFQSAQSTQVEQQSMPAQQPAQQPEQPVVQSVYPVDGTSTKEEFKKADKVLYRKVSRDREVKTAGVFAVVSANKGGVGKTTTIVALALALSKAGIKTLVWDLDFTGPNIHSFFNVKDKLGIESIAGKHITVQALAEIITKVKENLHILPGPMDKSIPSFTKEDLTEILTILRQSYPVVLADTPPGFHEKSWLYAIFPSADIVLSVVDQSKFSQEETATFAPKLLMMGVQPEKIRIVLNKFNPKLHNPRVVERQYNIGFKENIPKEKLPRIAATIPEDWEQFNKALYKGEIVGVNDPKSQWHILARELAEIARQTHSREKTKENIWDVFKEKEKD
ncbi:AAA family ATPase [Peptococcaceae bacterium]|nr:AAA family ATPase [Peptococcaceae bacterium]